MGHFECDKQIREQFFIHFFLQRSQVATHRRRCCWWFYGIAFVTSGRSTNHSFQNKFVRWWKSKQFAERISRQRWTLASGIDGTLPAQTKQCDADPQIHICICKLIVSIFFRFFRRNEHDVRTTHGWNAMCKLLLAITVVFGLLLRRIA